MNSIIGWALAAAAVAVGFYQWRWPGVALAATVIVFWLLLQFSQSLRVLRRASQAPVGHVDSAVMLNAKLHAGMRLTNILPLTRSLGVRVADEPAEAFEWRDGAANCVRVELRSGRCTEWRLTRPDSLDATPETTNPAEAGFATSGKPSISRDGDAP